MPKERNQKKRGFEDLDEKKTFENMTDLFPLLGNLEPKTMVEPVMEFEDLFSELLMEPKEKLIEFTPLEETTEELKFEQEEIINPSLVDVFTEKENLFP